MDNWTLSRKQFITTLMLGGIATQLPWLTGCAAQEPIPSDLSPLDQEAFLNLRALLLVLFPEDDNGPSALDVNADRFILWVLNDSELDPNENQYIIDKLEKLQALSVEEEGRGYHACDHDIREDLVERAIELGWGKRFFSRLLTLTFEALLLHPIYGGNPNEVGWLWLEHNPGQPRATTTLSYPEILKKKDEV